MSVYKEDCMPRFLLTWFFEVYRQQIEPSGGSTNASTHGCMAVGLLHMLSCCPAWWTTICKYEVDGGILQG